MIFRSIATQLQLWHCAVPSLLLNLLLILFYQNQEKALTENIDIELKSRISGILPFAHQVVASLDHENSAEAGESPTSPQTQLTVTPDAPVAEALDAGLYVRIFSSDNRLLWKSDGAPDLPNPDVQSPHKGTNIYTTGEYREAIQHTPQSYVVALGSSCEALSHQLNTLRWQLFGLGAGLIFMGWTVGYIITLRALRPLKTISQTARSISSGKRGQRINVDETKNELGSLAIVLNESFERQDAAFDQQVQFLADASHELRTPLAIILAKAHLGQHYTDPQSRTEALATCETAAKHMRDLIESLLDLSRLDSGVFELLTTPGDLAEMAQAAIDFIHPLAEEKNIKVRAKLTSAPSDFDQQRIRQVFINILSNAIKYNQPTNGWIEVTGRVEANHYHFSCTNSGKTIPAIDLPHLFDRFYRVDKSRTKSREGSAGLGLAITKSIVEAHGGRISAESANEVTTVTVLLPLPPTDQN
ncbi:Signal transduction histidine kinase [Rubritalea squalenifaciens DSM 18772]|uniref:histidine kinase n=1 Tax=Rubritalea squalenifaciens DSM 18772 TaxID=1123071 RepID=A0A1M6GYY3_9BACT|nr:ATP-binding protein [Rubritalea squalenifaciens]SHJ15178.1 Signal transduction histidine kinase [Rubritalea squalenifaciens DSM 18772]